MDEMRQFSLVPQSVEWHETNGYEMGGGRVLRCHIESQSLQGKLQVNVARLSPLGIEFLCPKEKVPLVLLDTIDVELTNAHFKARFTGILVSRVTHLSDMDCLFARWVEASNEVKPVKQERQADRWLCGAEALPTGIVANPLAFNDYIHVRIHVLSSRGMQISTSMRNQMLFPKMLLQGVLSFPLVGQCRAQFEIVHIRHAKAGEKDLLIAGCRFREPSKLLLSQTAEYLLQFCKEAHLEKLRKNNLVPKSLVPAISSRYVRTQEEYQNVILLRSLGWQGVSPAEGLKQDKALLADETDLRSRIVLVSWNGQAIATFRVVFPEAGIPLEFEEYWPKVAGMPKRSEMVEISRLVIHPQYRHLDILFYLVHRLAEITLQAGRRYLVTTPSNTLVSLHERLGFKIKGEPQMHPLFGVPFRLAIGDMHRMAVGYGMNPLFWNIISRDFTQFLTSNEILSFGVTARLHLAFYRLFYPLARLYLWYLQLRKVRRKAPNASHHEKSA